MELCVLDACPLEALPSLYFDWFADVVQVDLATVVHERREGKGLPTWTCTIVKYGLLRFGIDSHGKQLTSFILYFKMTLFELNLFEQVALGRFRESNAVWSEFGRLHLPPQLLKPFHQFFPCRPQCVRSQCQLWLLIHHCANLLSLVLSMSLSYQSVQVTILGYFNVIWHVFFLGWRQRLSSLKSVWFVHV